MNQIQQRIYSLFYRASPPMPAHVCVYVPGVQIVHLDIPVQHLGQFRKYLYVSA